jgi:hypothetical protein
VCGVSQVARGRLSKQIAHDIGIAEATVKVRKERFGSLSPREREPAFIFCIALLRCRLDVAKSIAPE